MAELLLFATSILPVIIIGLYMYKKDNQKEPILLLLKLFIGGIGSCFLVIIISKILGLILPIFSASISELNGFDLIIHVFICVALVEEFSKWLIAYKISYNDYNFDEFFDMIIYCVYVALGFAFFENLFYVYSYGITTGIVRALLAVPGHACDGMLMGYYLGLAKINKVNNRNNQSNKYLFLSILIPTITHGIYDYLLSLNGIIPIIIFIVFIIIMYIYVIKNINKISKIHGKIKEKVCPNCNHIIDDNFCAYCGRKNED